MRGSGEIPNGLGMAQLWPILNAPSMRPVVHNTLRRWRESLAAWAAWAIDMYSGAGLSILISAAFQVVSDFVHIVEKGFWEILVEGRQASV